MNNKKLLLAYYGDDFTGSTDALEFLTMAGARTVLFIKPPTKEQLLSYEGLDAIGVAGMTRSMVPEEMEKELFKAFNAFKRYEVPHIHYKVCSTFDSSPFIGSIGKAIDVGAAVFESPFIPLLVAAPTLGRYCAFGNLFARMGIGTEGPIYRLDRHPSMRSHPVTPANESDLRVHLSRQTTKKIGLMNILQMALNKQDMTEALEIIIAEESEIVLFDALYPGHITSIGRLIDEYASVKKPLFSVGSSGIEMALGNHWIEQSKLQPVSSWPSAGKSEPLLVVSGSCSPVTSAQISWALYNGFSEVVLDIQTIIKNNSAESLIHNYIERTLTLLKEGKSVIIHTDCNSRNPPEGVKPYSEEYVRTSNALLFGNTLGEIVKSVLAQVKIKRLVIAGGDTSSYAARAMGIEAVEMFTPFAPGAPLCKTYAPGSPLDGIEINFKGGQVGTKDYFGLALEGKMLTDSISLNTNVY